MAVSPVMLALTNCGADDGIVIVRAGGDGGVREKPPCIAKDGVITMFPAVVPVCNAIEVAFPLNSACVELAGIVKLTVRPPLANWMEESSAKAAGTKVSVSVPCNADGYGEARVRPMAGCWAACTFPEPP